MNVDTRKPQKDSRSESETADERIIHYVCHGCSDVEGTSSSMGVAQTVARTHEHGTGHDVSVEVVGGSEEVETR